MKALVVIVLVLAAACGGKSNGASKPDDPAVASCCCNLSDGRELLGEANCSDRGGTCDPVSECESTDEPVDPDGGDPDQY